MNKMLLAVVVIALGIGVGWYYFKGAMHPSKRTDQMTAVSPTQSQDMTTTSGSSNAVASATVSYTDSGFSPKTVTVRKGTTVTFKNTSTGTMWVVTGVYPTNQLLPGFDEKAAVATGGMYQYTFTKVGTWQYYNHAKTTDEAFVVVTE